jgi:putative heme-binding domain-containing protein
LRERLGNRADDIVFLPARSRAFLAGDARRKRVAFVSDLQRLPPEKRWEPVEGFARSSTDADDPEIPLLLWYAIEPMVPQDMARAASLIGETKIPLIREFIARRLTSIPASTSQHSGLNYLSWRVGAMTDVDVQRDILRGVTAALAGQRDHELPTAWKHAYAIFETSSSTEVRDLAFGIAVIFGDAKALESLHALVRDSAADKNRREKALQSLIFKMPPGLRETLDPLLDDPALRPAAIRALARFDDAKIPPRLLGLYEKLPPPEREDVRQTLASRPTFALALLDAVVRKQVDRKDLSTVIVRQMLALKDKTVADRVAEVWGVIRPASAQKAELTAKYKKLLTADSIRAADPVRGHAVFTKQCASCHKLFGEGGNVGPDLTGSQRANLEYVLENVLDPSAVVAKEYLATVVATTAGRTITGIVKEDNDRTLTLQTANEVLVLPKNEIESRVQSKLSMMPDGILEQLPIDDVRALVAYLARKTPLEGSSK